MYDRGVRARRSVLLASIFGLSIAGCDGLGPAQIYVPPGTTTSSTGGGSGSTSTAGSGGASTGTASTGGLSPVLVAITATPASDGDTPTEAAEIEADLATFGAGARAAIVTLPWSDVPEGSDEALAKRIAFYASHDKRVLVNLAVVDRLADRRPPEVQGEPWNATSTLDAAHAALDTIFAAGGASIGFVTFGRDVDRWLAAHPGERAAFVAFAKEVCAYAKEHAPSPDLVVGVALSPDAPKSDPSFADLLDAGDVVAFSYLPGLGTYETDAASGVAAAITALADAAGSKPIVLQAAGAPTDGLAGGSEVAQQTYFSTLFGAIGARRGSFVLVDVMELHDAPHAECAAWAVSQGEPADGPMAAYACSLGVWKTDGTPKPAWSAVIAGAAALSTP